MRLLGEENSILKYVICLQVPGYSTKWLVCRPLRTFCWCARARWCSRAPWNLLRACCCKVPVCILSNIYLRDLFSSKCNRTATSCCTKTGDQSGRPIPVVEAATASSECSEMETLYSTLAMATPCLDPTLPTWTTVITTLFSSVMATWWCTLQTGDPFGPPTQAERSRSSISAQLPLQPWTPPRRMSSCLWQEDDLTNELTRRNPSVSYHPKKQTNSECGRSKQLCANGC